MENSFARLLKDKKAKGSLADLKKCYTEELPKLVQKQNEKLTTENGASTEKNILMDQYKLLIDVYLKNHDEYRQIQTQVYTIITGLVSASAVAINWVFNNNNLYAVPGIVFLCFFSWVIRGPIVSSIHKNRLFHECTAFYIRAVEDNLGLYNIPLRSNEFCDDFWEAFEGRKNFCYLKCSTGGKWSDNIALVFWVIPIALSIISVAGIIYLCYMVF